MALNGAIIASTTPWNTIPMSPVEIPVQIFSNAAIRFPSQSIRVPKTASTIANAFIKEYSKSGTIVPATMSPRNPKTSPSF